MHQRLACLLALLATACAAPAHVGRHRSALLDPPDAPLVPEGRVASVPSSSGQPGGQPGVQEVPLEGRGPAIARQAASRIGAPLLVSGKTRFPNDCTGLVRAAYADLGIDLFADGGESGDNGVTAIYRFVGKHGLVHGDAPRPGDLVFFRDTYDRNRDGRFNDGLTHVGIVEGVDARGTVTFIHHVDRGVVRERLSLERPGEHRDPSTGETLNDWLRPGRTPRLSGELFAGFGTLVRLPQPKQKPLPVAAKAHDTARRCGRTAARQGQCAPSGR